ncbi:MAG: hypothetical protein ACOX1Y_13660 [Zhaonellaceae bacterium]|jgi:hypothetical protein
MTEKKVRKDPWGLAVNIFNFLFTITCLSMGVYVFVVLIPQVVG